MEQKKQHEEKKNLIFLFLILEVARIITALSIYCCFFLSYHCCQWITNCNLFALRHLFSRRVVKHWHWLPRGMVESPSLEGFKKDVDVALNSWFSGGLGNSRLMVGLDELGGFFQHKWLYNTTAATLKMYFPQLQLTREALWLGLLSNTTQWMSKRSASKAEIGGQAQK